MTSIYEKVKAKCHDDAVKYGVSPSLIGKIRRNKAWADFKSPFAGLGARM